MANLLRNNRDTEMLVIGGGPAGCSSAVSAQSLGIAVSIIEKHRLGGQIHEIEKIENVAGGIQIGKELACAFQKQIEQYGIPVITSEAVGIRRIKKKWEVRCDSGIVVRADVIMAATGSRELRLAEHPLISNVDRAHQDRFIYEVTAEEWRSNRITIVGSDRVILSLIRSRGAEIKKANITVLALPDKWYVIDDVIQELPFEIIRISKVLSLDLERQGDLQINYIDQPGANRVIRSNVVLTNLGKVPNTGLFHRVLRRGPDGYLIPKDYVGESKTRTIYPIGDVAHKAFQRISTAVGDGAYASLDYFYGRHDLYQSRSRAKS